MKDPPYIHSKLKDKKSRQKHNMLAKQKPMCQFFICFKVRENVSENYLKFGEILGEKMPWTQNLILATETLVLLPYHALFKPDRFSSLLLLKIC